MLVVLAWSVNHESLERRSEIDAASASIQSREGTLRTFDRPGSQSVQGSSAKGVWHTAVNSSPLRMDGNFEVCLSSVAAIATDRQGPHHLARASLLLLLAICLLRRGTNIPRCEQLRFSTRGKVLELDHQSYILDLAHVTLKVTWMPSPTQ